MSRSHQGSRASHRYTAGCPCSGNLHHRYGSPFTNHTPRDLPMPSNVCGDPRTTQLVAETNRNRNKGDPTTHDHGLVNIDNATTILGGGVSLTIIAGALFAAVKWLRPWLVSARVKRRVEKETLYGRPERVDPVTKEIQPARPGVGEGLFQLTQEVQGLTGLLTRVVRTDENVAAHTREIEDLKRRVGNLEGQELERAAGRYESAKAFEAMGKLAEGASPDEALE